MPEVLDSCVAAPRQQKLGNCCNAGKYISSRCTSGWCMTVCEHVLCCCWFGTVAIASWSEGLYQHQLRRPYRVKACLAACSQQPHVDCCLCAGQCCAQKELLIFVPAISMLCQHYHSAVRCYCLALLLCSPSQLLPMSRCACTITAASHSVKGSK